MNGLSGSRKLKSESAKSVMAGSRLLIGRGSVTLSLQSCKQSKQCIIHYQLHLFLLCHGQRQRADNSNTVLNILRPLSETLRTKAYVALNLLNPSIRDLQVPRTQLIPSCCESGIVESEQQRARAESKLQVSMDVKKFPEIPTCAEIQRVG
jgi:hypothetical protein